MPGLAEVGGGVLMRAGIAASDVPAGQAHPKMGPGVRAVIGAFLAAARGQWRRLYDSYGGLKMLAGLRDGLAPSGSLQHVEQG